MLFVFLLLFTATIAFDNPTCDHVVLLEKDVAIGLPKYPFDKPSATCQWTVVSDWDTQVILSCTTIDRPDSTTDLDDPCYGNFTVVDDYSERTNHCRDRAFSRISGSNRLTITYKERPNENIKNYDSSGFQCYLYSILEEDTVVQNTTTIGKPNFKSCDYDLNLLKNDLIRLDNPKNWQDDPDFTGCRWKVHTTEKFPIIFVCPFTDKPPEPLTIQMAPCSGLFQVKYDGITKNHQCTERSFSHVTAKKGEMEITYWRPPSKRYENFECYLSLQAPDETALPRSPFQSCDEFVEIKYGEVYEVKAPARSMPCRWTLLGPTDAKMTLNCVFPKGTHTKPSDDPKSPCKGEVRVLLAGGEEKHYCGGQGFQEYSSNNQMVVTYQNITNDPANPFKCLVTLERKNAPCLNCTSPDSFNFKNCNFTLHFDGVGVQQTLRSPNYPAMLKLGSACLWTVTYPNHSQINLDCTFGKLGDGSCKGHFTVYQSEMYDNAYEVCNDRPFTYITSGNRSKTFITYSGPGPLLPYQCTITTYSDICEKEVQFDNVKEFVKEELVTSPWPVQKTPFKECIWHVDAPQNYRLNISCEFQRYQRTCERRLVIAPPFSKLFDNGTLYCFEEVVNIPSYGDHLSVKFADNGKELAPDTKIGCTIYPDKRPLCDCGKSILANKTGKVKEPRDGELPMVALIISTTRNMIVCITTIIGKRHSIASASCIKNAQIYNPTLGIIAERASLQNLKIAEINPIVNIMFHPQYKANPPVHDIAIVKTKDDFTFLTPTAGLACLPFKKPDEVGYPKVMAIGLNGDKLDYIRGILEPVAHCDLHKDATILAHQCLRQLQDRELCDHRVLTANMRKVLENSFHSKNESTLLVNIAINHFSNTAVNFAYRNITNQTFAYNYDSGAPVLWAHPVTKRLKLVAIRNTFFNDQCKKGWRFNVTDIGYYLDWIDQNTPDEHFCRN